MDDERPTRSSARFAARDSETRMAVRQVQREPWCWLTMGYCLPPFQRRNMATSS